MNNRVLAASAAILIALIASKASATQLIVNGGFEGGVGTVGANTNVPVGWTPDAAFAADPSYSRVGAANPHSGLYSLEIGDFDASAVDSVSQTFSDISGTTYTVGYFAFASLSGDPNAFLSVSIDGAPLSTLTDNVNNYPSSATTFTFTGTGSDTLTIAARTNPGDWYIDDVTVNSAAVVTGVPEPATWALMMIGFGAVGAAMRLRSKQLALGA